MVVMVSSNKRLEKIQLNYPVNAVHFTVQYWDKTQPLVLSASSPFCSNIVFKNAERYCGVFTVELRGPTAAPPQTENCFLVLKIECTFCVMFVFLYVL